MKKKERNIYLPFFLSFLALISISMFFSCHAVSDKKSNIVFAPPDSILPPVITKAGNSDVHNLDTLPPPTVALLSQKPAPVKTPAGFYVTMQNFNTEDGLALSSILGSYKDNAGNLWFGTSGNGVSMYNGKSFTNYSSAHGLIHNLINCITEDSKGNIWFGTYGGASTYDGITFKNFTTQQGLIDNNVYKIFEDKKGTIWLATSQGVSRYDPAEKGTGQHLFTNYNAEDGLTNGTVTDIMQDKKGFLWFVGSQGVSRYNPVAEAGGQKAFDNFSEAFGIQNEIIYTILEDEEGMIWVGARGFLGRYDPAREGTSQKTFTHFTTADGLADNFVLSSMQDREGNLWFGTKGGVSEYIRADSSFLNFTMEQGLADNQVESIIEDHSGSLWFSTYGGGISKYNGKSLIEFTANQGLPGKAVYMINEDQKGNLWFAPLDGGLVEYQRKGVAKIGGTFVNYTSAQGYPDNTAYSSVEDSKGNLWFAMSEGLCKYDGTSFTTYSTKQGLPDDYINALATDKEGNLWIGTYDGGVSKFDGKAFTNLSTGQGLVHQTVWSIFEDKNGIIWIATRGGLSRFDGMNFMNFAKAQGLPDNKLSTVTQDSKGNILIGSWGGGVSIIRKKRLEKLALKDAGQNSESIFENFSTNEGLANHVVYNILEDNSGNIVIGTSMGLTVLKGGIGTENGKIVENGIENYNEKTGYPIKDVSNNFSMYEDSRGFIWAGTGDKLVRFDYSSVHKSAEAPHVSLQNIEINNELISWRSLARARTKEHAAKPQDNTVSSYVTDELLTFGRTLSLSERDSMIDKFSDIRFAGIRSFNTVPENLVLPYAKNNISFNFVGIETTRPHLVRYRYKLNGNDENWSPVTEKTTATFGNVFEGTYTFMVQAQSPDGVWSKPLMYNFKILPPWWRTWWSYAFYLLVFAAGVFAVDRYQRQRLIQREREKIQKKELEQARKIEKAYNELKIARKKEQAQAKEIEKAYNNMEAAHKNLQAAQEQLVKQEKLASLGQLTAGIAHEIKNPLNFVNNFSEVSLDMIEEVRENLRNQNTEYRIQNTPSVERILLEEEGLKVKAERGDGKERANNPDMDYTLTILNDIEVNLRKIHEHGSRADRIVKSMLQHSRGGSGKMEPVNLNALVKEFVNLAFHGMRAGKHPINVDMEINFDADMGEVSLIAEDFSRVIVNLCGNAFDAMREKLSAFSDQPSAYKPRLTVKTCRKDGEVVMEIADNGPGIPDDIKEKILQPFFTTKKGTEGTGLGLYITNDIIKAHGGELEIQSQPGSLTRFIIKIPTQITT